LSNPADLVFTNGIGILKQLATYCPGKEKRTWMTGFYEGFFVSGMEYGYVVE
jgi:hypothetical protein